MPGTLSLKPRIGVQDLVYALLNESSDVAGGTPTFGTIYSMAATAKIGVKVNGKAVTLFADDAARLIAETIGEIEIAIDMADILPADMARLLGHSYANGTMGATGVDQSPYVAVGFKILRTGVDGAGAPAYDYFWFYKGKFAKFDMNAETKADTIKWQTQSLVGKFAALIANGLYKAQLRTDDPNVPTTVQSGFFSQVTFPSSDLSALTVAFAAGAATKTVTATFTKASNSGSIPFTMAAAALLAALANEVQIVKQGSGGGLCTVSWALTTPGAGYSNNTIVFTGTITAGAVSTNVVAASVRSGSQVIDNNGVSVAAIGNGNITLV